MEPKHRPLTVLDVVKHVLPQGSRTEHGKPSWDQPPTWPPDLFAVAGQLLLVGGVFNFIVPPGASRELTSQARYLSLTSHQIRDLQHTGEQWRTRWPSDGGHSSQLSDLWHALIEAGGGPVYRLPRRPNTPHPQWWRPTHSLFVIADEASEGVGYFEQASPELSDARKIPLANYVRYLEALREGQQADPLEVRLRSNLPPTVANRADQDVICVVPKSRTASVGVTPRTFSHNLALLPPRGPVKVQWHRPNVRLERENLHYPFRILAIPYPYRIDRSWFKSSRGEEPMATGHFWLDLDQSWLTNHEDVCRFLVALAKQAVAEHGEIAAIVLPEDSINWITYHAVAKALRDEVPSVRFFVAGSSGNCLDETGAFVIATQFYTPVGQSDRQMVHTSRAKHHRWRLDRDQANAYGLLGLPLASPPVQRVLDNGFHFGWELIGVPQREVHAHVIKSSTTITPLICEDLARMDPCHSVIRDIGPNIVVALLLDGPQLKSRWSARYALALAEDPGTSVLTLTSRGMIHLANEARRSAGLSESWAIGLWKDDGSLPIIEIDCPPNLHGIVLSLNGKAADEYTYDGRKNTDASAWRLDPSTGISPIRLYDADLVERIEPPVS